MMTVTGWFAANGCIHPGMLWIGTFALEMNEKGITNIDIPCAACALPETSPIVMKIQVKA